MKGRLFVFSILVGILSGCCTAFLICSQKEIVENDRASMFNSLELTFPSNLDPFVDPDQLFVWLTSLATQSQQKVIATIQHRKRKLHINVTEQKYLVTNKTDLMFIRFFPKSVEVNGEVLSENDFHEKILSYLEACQLLSLKPSFLISVVSKEQGQSFYTFLELVSNTNSEIAYMPTPTIGEETVPAS